MVAKGIAMHKLSSEERHSLIDLVVERHGRTLNYEAFADVILGLFEDLSGFETTPPSKANRIVHHLWSTYHGKESREA